MYTRRLSLSSMFETCEHYIERHCTCAVANNVPSPETDLFCAISIKRKTINFIKIPARKRLAVPACALPATPNDMGPYAVWIPVYLHENSYPKNWSSFICRSPPCQQPLIAMLWETERKPCDKLLLRRQGCFDEFISFDGIFGIAIVSNLFCSKYRCNSKHYIAGWVTKLFAEIMLQLLDPDSSNYTTHVECSGQMEKL